MTKFKSFLIILCLGYSSFGFAMDLREAKDQGLVGEMKNGYLSAVESKHSKEIDALVTGINSKRKAHYQKIAAKVGKSLQTVEQLAGEKAQGKTQTGNYIQLPNDKWKKK
ncbi:MAG: hypothetical protein ACJA0N_001950 [Pseudohongiellaceae bacterium]|jgi:uncharacterized protein YdbL (DUF1318 family)